MASLAHNFQGWDKRAKKYLSLFYGISVLNRKQKLAFIEHTTFSTLKGIINLLFLFHSNLNLIQEGRAKQRLVKCKSRLSYLWNCRNNKKDNKTIFNKSLFLLDLLSELVRENAHVIIEKGLPKCFTEKKAKKGEKQPNQQEENKGEN